MSIEYRDANASKNAGVTYHLALQQEWDAAKAGDSYAPGAYATDGFIHCTNGLDLLTNVANMFYKESPEERTILVLIVERIESPVVYEDEAQTFPHIYGQLNTSAVIDELPVSRGADGTFTWLGTEGQR